MHHYKILIVEDELINAQYILSVLKKLNHIVVDAVSSAKEAIEVIKNNKIEIVFMDINIDGDIDGIECAQIINQENEIAIIYTTAYCDSETIDRAGKTNIYGYLIKPFNAKDIEAIVHVTQARLSNDNVNSNDINLLSLNNKYIYNKTNKTLMIKDKDLNLTKKESELLYLFCTNLYQTLSFEVIQESIWNGKNIGNSTIRDTILRIRKKAPLLDIISISGIGYRLNKDTQTK